MKTTARRVLERLNLLRPLLEGGRVGEFPDADAVTMDEPPAGTAPDDAALDSMCAMVRAAAADGDWAKCKKILAAFERLLSSGAAAATEGVQRWTGDKKFSAVREGRARPKVKTGEARVLAIAKEEKVRLGPASVKAFSLLSEQDCRQAVRDTARQKKARKPAAGGNGSGRWYN
jgi:hypothetical protein